MANLSQLGQHYGTDKVLHGFIPIYETYFSGRRESIRHILEIGVFFGSSIQMWRDYFPKAVIHGMDSFQGHQGNGQIFANADNFWNQWQNGNVTQSERIRLYRYDQSQLGELDAFVDSLRRQGIQFDAILDDGSHLMRDQQITLGKLWTLIRPGGCFIMEDLHTSLSHAGDYHDILPDKSNTTLTLFQEFQKTGQMNSIYIDLSPIVNQIQSMQIETSPKGSITAFIHKRGNPI